MKYGNARRAEYENKTAIKLHGASIVVYAETWREANAARLDRTRRKGRHINRFRDRYSQSCSSNVTTVSIYTDPSPLISTDERDRTSPILFTVLFTINLYSLVLW